MSHGLVVKAEDSQLSGCGFESRHRILVSFYNLKIMKTKVDKWGTPKKKYLKKPSNNLKIIVGRNGKGFHLRIPFKNDCITILYTYPVTPPSD